MSDEKRYVLKLNEGELLALQEVLGTTNCTKLLREQRWEEEEIDAYLPTLYGKVCGLQIPK